ncbi:MAG: SemiSWEET transporter [Methylococcaceae bacterium]|nr:SemiSWEET transporter [Methylococcaceae bacterium]
MIHFVGFIAAILTTAAFVPQALKTIKTKDTASISLWMYVIFTAGVLCWLIYGIGIANVPIILANLVTLALAATILLFKIKYK